MRWMHAVAVRRPAVIDRRTRLTSFAVIFVAAVFLAVIAVASPVAAQESVLEPAAAYGTLWSLGPGPAAQDADEGAG